MENRTDSFAAVIGDIKDSRKLENRKYEEEHSASYLLNRKYGKTTAIFWEMKGNVSGKNILIMMEKMEMSGLRFGIGFGTITTDIRREMALGADGPGYYRAREAVEVLKEREKKNRPVPADLCLKMGEEDRDKEVLLNTVFDLLYVVEEGWTERQREIIWDMLVYGDGQQNTAARLSISQPTVQKALAAGSYYTYENALKNAAEILGEIQYD